MSVSLTHSRDWPPRSRCAEARAELVDGWLNPRLRRRRDARRPTAGRSRSRGVPSLELMEAAGRALADAVAGPGAAEGPVRIVCGKGNNGGDGLVAARDLAETGFEVEVLLLGSRRGALRRRGGEPRALRRPGAGAARGRARRGASRARASSSTRSSGPASRGRPASPARRRSRRSTAAGRRSSPATSPPGSTPRAARSRGLRSRPRSTVTFHAAKVGHSIAPGQGSHRRAAGRPDRDPRRRAGRRPPPAVIDPSVLGLAPRRGAASTKFTSGQVVVVGGSRGLTGAVCLAAEAAIRSGRRLRDRRRPGRPRGNLRGEADRGDVEGVPGRGGRLGRRVRRGGPRGLRAGGRGRPRPRPRPRTAARPSVARALAERIEAPLVIDADGLDAHRRPASRRSRPAPRRPF